ncbi:MAG: hypothetical protein ABSE27_00135 [Acidobacteriaceae bacterium]
MPKKTMKLVRSDSPEVVRNIASAGAWASRNWYTLGTAYAANVLAILIALTVSLSVSVRAAAWVTVPVLLSLNGYVLWRTKASHRRWVLVGCANRLYLRLFAWCRGDHGDDHDPDVLVLEVSEITSMSIKTVEVFVYGPKPEFSEWLVIEPAQAVGDDISRHIRPLLTATDPDKAVLVAYDEGRITIEWKWWRPALRVFLQQVVQECPSVVIAAEERSELDLNGIWTGSLEPNAHQRQMLGKATRLGFGCECAQRISQYKHMSFRKASAYLAEIEREEAGLNRQTEQPHEQE